MRPISARFRRGTLLGAVAACLALGVLATAHAAQWADIATISSTLGNNAYRICTGGGATGLGCPGYAPLVGPSGDVTATGNMAASHFYGDGSGLTNLNLSGVIVDRIVSNTAGVYASNTGVVSIYGASGLAAYFDTTGQFVSGAISITTPQGISSTNGYFSDNIRGGADLYLGSAANDGDIWLLDTAGNSRIVFDAQNGHSFINTPAGYNFGIKTIVPSQTLHVVGSALITSWTGINFSGSRVTPTAPLEVLGTVSATAFVGDGSGLTNLNLSGSVNDRITSGTAGVFVSNSGVINLRTGGATTGYFDASGLLVAPGISLTTGHGISSTSGYFSAPLVVGQTSTSMWFSSSGTSTTSIYNRLLVYADAANNYSPTDNADLTIFSLNRNAGLNLAGGATALYFWPVQSYLGKIYAGYSQAQVGSVNYDTNGNAGNNFGTYNFRFLVSGTQVMQLLSTSTILSATLRTTSWTLINANSHTRTPMAPLEVLGTVSATAFVGNGSGLTNLPAANLSETISLNDLSDASVSTALGSMYVGAGVGNNAIVTGSLGMGVEALQSNVTGYRSTGLGYQALKSNTSGVDNTAVGAFTLASNTTGANNIAMGVGALSQNTTGNGNVALGRGAMTRNSSAYYNIGIGYSAGAWMSSGQRNIIIGYNGGFYNTSGNNNVLVGTNVGQGVNGTTTYGDTVMVGSRAGTLLETGASNTFIGSSAASTQSSGQYNIALGAESQLADVNGNYQLSIGNVIYGDLSRGRDSRIGINVTNPTTNLEVSGTVSATAFVGDGSGLTNINAGAVSGLSTDRITSGTAGVFVSNTGVINLRTGGTTTGYFDTAGLLVVPGVSTTGMISTTNLYLQPTYTHPYYVPATKFAAIYSGGDLNNSFILATNGAYTFFGARNNTMALSTVRDVAGSPDDVVVQHANLTSTITSLVLKGTSGWVAVGSGRWIDPSASLHVSGTVRVTSWTMLNANTTPTTPLEVSGTISATAFVGNGSGLTNLPAANLSETISINDLSDASSTYASGNLFMGPYAASQVTGGSNNTAVGVLALASSTTGSYNTAIGYKAMQNYTGTALARNVAVGYRAMNQMSTGTQNTAFGFDSLYYNTAGSNNTAIGSAAMVNGLGSHNTVVGRYALYNNAYGNDNVAVGMEVGAGTPSTSQYISTSVLLGSRAGYNLGYAQNNVLIGYRAGYTMTNGNYNIVIGTDTTMPYNTAGSYQLNLGNALYGDLSGAATANARLGINVASPTLALEVSGTVSATLVQVSAKTPPSSDCDDATDYGKLGLDPATFQPRMCLPR